MKSKGFVLLLLIVVLLSACATSSIATTHIENAENGDFIHSDIGYRSVTAKELPHDIPYNGKNIVLKKVESYQTCIDYSYYLYVVLTLDVGELDESELHWLTTEDMSTSVYITQEENDLDFSGMYQLGSVYFSDSNELVIVKSTIGSLSSKDCRKPFYGARVRPVVTLTQEEKYEYTSSTGKKTMKHTEESLSINIELEDDLPDAETIEKPLYDYVGKWLYDKAAWYKSMLDKQ